MKLLLDTCTFLWIAERRARLPPRVAAAYRSPDNEVFLSAASAWEIAIEILARAVFMLPEPPDAGSPTERRARGVDGAGRSTKSRRSTSSWLPLLHRDPFDRLLVSQAIVHGMTILTPDPILARYPARTMW